MTHIESPAQKIHFDSSGLKAALDFLDDKSAGKLCQLAESPGGSFAYKHFRWSNINENTTGENFWADRLNKFTESKRTVETIMKLRDYVVAQSRSHWLPGVLDYLPKGHRFDTTVYLNLGYDNVALGGDVALNLGSPPFLADSREAVYYLMHELAHAGYLSYHETPDLAAPGTSEELAANVRFLTHLEGMGVITPLKLRYEEGGLGDPDYIALGDTVERRRRVCAYLEAYLELAGGPCRKISDGDLRIYDLFSRKPSRLWYVAGCHMAQTIEAAWGRDVLRELVRGGCDGFFKAYREAPDPLLV